METKLLAGSKRMTRREFWAESDRLLQEAQGFLATARRIREASQHLRRENRRKIEALRQHLSCGKD